MERVVDRANMIRAYRRVVGNKGSAGVDGMSVAQLKPYLDKHWDRIKKELYAGTYQPQPVREVLIPKAKGGERALGIPTVVDRLLQQALSQVLGPYFEPHFSAHSYGFRAGKSAHQAVEQARTYQVAGKRWVVDLDLEKFFDRVHHDVLITLVRRRVNESCVLKLIRAYLRGGIMRGGVYTPRMEGTPQGSPLSPLLSNIMLDELDKELEGRGHAFVRYADDVNIYVHSERSGERVLGSITRWLNDRLRLKVNASKSTVARPWKRTFLGYSFTAEQNPRIRVPKESVQRLKKKVKHLVRKGRGRNLDRLVSEDLNPLLRGWMNYFRLAEVRRFAGDLDGWVRRKLRNIRWRQWKRPWTRMQRLMLAGIAENRAARSAFNGRGPWWNSGASHMNEAYPKKFFDYIGLFSLLDYLSTVRKTAHAGTARYGTVRRVV